MPSFFIFFTTSQLLRIIKKSSSSNKVAKITNLLVKRLIRPSFGLFGYHNTLIENGVIDIVLNSLEMYCADVEIVKINFELLMILIERDRKHERECHKTALILNRLEQSRIIEEVFNNHKINEDVRVMGRFIIRNIQLASGIATVEKLR